MIHKVKEIIHIRDYDDGALEFHLCFPNEIVINLELGELNKLYGENPKGSKILKSEIIPNFYDKKGHFVFNKRLSESTAIYLEPKKGYELKDLVISRDVELHDILKTDRDSLIYAFYLTPNSNFVIRGTRHKSNYTVSLIQQSPFDARTRYMLFERCLINSTRISYSPEDLLTSDQFAEFLSMPKGTFHNKLSKSEIMPPKNIGGSNRWKFRDIIDWIDDL